MSQISNVTVHKLGGSCLIDEKSFEKILTIVDNYKNGGLILVASAMQGVTNQLIKFMQDCNTHSIKPEDVIKELKDKHLKIAGEVIKDEANLNLVSSFLSDLSTQLKEALTKIYDLCLINPQLTDQVIAFGERFSTSILYYYLKSKGHPVRFFQADNLIITDSNYTNALPKLDKTKKLIESQLIPVIKNGEIPVVTGFLAKSEDGFVTTLGRGGSDFTATLIAYSIVESFKQTKVILWKDVDGLLTANPKYVPNAKLIKNISYREAKELAFFGSKIIHPMCLIPLEEKKIPMEIRNFSKPLSSDYTTFTTERQVKRDIVKALTAKEDVALITVEGAAMVSLPGTAAKLFEILGNNNINIIMISQASSENNITLVVDRADKDRSEAVLKASDFFGRRWIKINAVNDVSLIAVVGAGMLNTPGIAARIFKSLAERNINIIAIAQGSSEMNISLVIPRLDISKALQAIHDEFKLSAPS